SRRPRRRPSADARRVRPLPDHSAAPDPVGGRFICPEGALQDMTPRLPHDFLLERMVRAVEKVRERLLRATAALEQAGVPYAIIGGNAVAAWVAHIDEAAARNTPNVDILLRRRDLEAARVAMEKPGFTYFHHALFLDGPDAKARSAVQVRFAAERVRP